MISKIIIYFTFKGANGPLLRRVSVLQSDWFEANQLPSDYETDLEFFWSNPSNIIRLKNDINKHSYRESSL